MTPLRTPVLSNRQKLRYTKIFIVLFLTVLPAIIGLLLHVGWYFWIPVMLFPLFSLIVCFLHTGGFADFSKKITLIKYNSFCPLFFYYDPVPDRYRFKKCNDLQKIICPGDILLRRHRNYMDGLVLGQTSFFTHAGIYYGDYGVLPSQVLHAVGDGGVGFISLENFSRCDDVLVLRFDDAKDTNETEIDKSTLPELPAVLLVKKPGFLQGADVQAAFERIRNISGNTGSIEAQRNAEPNNAAVPPLRPKKVQKDGSVYEGKIVFIRDTKVLFAQEEEDVSAAVREACGKEYPIYTSILETLPDSNVCCKVYRHQYIDAVKSIALAEYGKPYDYDFNFTDFTYLSCVEFVWFCYKCLYPLHAVHRDYYPYFSWIKAYVITPDSFIKSRFFKIVYASIDANSKKIKETNESKVANEDLKEHILAYVAKHRIKFWLFCFKIIGWEISILLFIKSILYFLF